MIEIGCTIEVGTRVEEICTGDVGIVVGMHADRNRGVWVRWETGLCSGEILHITEDKLKVLEVPVDDSKIAECMKILIDAGYTVTKE